MSFNKLYLDAKKYIITFLDLQSLGRMCQVSKEMKDLICNENKDLRVETYIKEKMTTNLLNLMGVFLQCCKKGGPIIVIGYLIRNKHIDPSSRHNYAIRWASKNGHTEIVKALLSDPRVDPSDEDNYAIRRATRNGHTEVIKLLLCDSRVDCNLAIYGQVKKDAWIL
jgi:aspartate 1-decarboxylase